MYNPPEGSRRYHNNEIWEEIGNDIMAFTTNETPFLVIGDLNARTGSLSDFPKDNHEIRG
jgi:hypothetical protein